MGEQILCSGVLSPRVLFSSPQSTQEPSHLSMLELGLLMSEPATMAFLGFAPLRNDVGFGGKELTYIGSKTGREVVGTASRNKASDC